MARDFLPDSRCRNPNGDARFPLWTGEVVAHVPIFCANCGVPNGFVPKDFCTFAFWLCDLCCAAHGTIAHTYTEPDRVFWERVREATREGSPRALTTIEIADALADPTSPLARLVEDFRHGRIALQ